MEGSGSVRRTKGAVRVGSDAPSRPSRKMSPVGTAERRAGTHLYALSCMPVRTSHACTGPSVLLAPSTTSSRKSDTAAIPGAECLTCASRKCGPGQVSGERDTNFFRHARLSSRVPGSLGVAFRSTKISGRGSRCHRCLNAAHALVLRLTALWTLRRKSSFHGSGEKKEGVPAQKAVGAFASGSGPARRHSDAHARTRRLAVDRRAPHYSHTRACGHARPFARPKVRRARPRVRSPARTPT